MSTRLLSQDIYAGHLNQLREVDFLSGRLILIACPRNSVPLIESGSSLPCLQNAPLHLILSRVNTVYVFPSYFLQKLYGSKLLRSFLNAHADTCGTTTGRSATCGQGKRKGKIERNEAFVSRLHQAKTASEDTLHWQTRKWRHGMFRRTSQLSYRRSDGSKTESFRAIKYCCTNKKKRLISF